VDRRLRAAGALEHLGLAEQRVAARGLRAAHGAQLSAALLRGLVRRDRAVDIARVGALLGGDELGQRRGRAAGGRERDRDQGPHSVAATSAIALAACITAAWSTSR